MDPAPVTFDDREPVAVVVEPFSDTGLSAKEAKNKSADGIEFLRGECRAHALVEVVQSVFSADKVFVAVGDDLGGSDVVLVDDLADELFDDVFDGDQTGGAAHFVLDDRHLRLLKPHLGQEVVEGLGFGDEVCGANEFAQGWRARALWRRL